MSRVMEGRRVLVTGARNRWSIAWQSAVSLHREGATLAFSVLGDREQKSVEKLLVDAGIVAPIFQCDASEDEQVERLMQQTSEHFRGVLDGLIHAIAFANKEELDGEYIATSKSGFLLAHERSVYTLVNMSRSARQLLAAEGGGSIVTLTYLGAERVVSGYNVMGVAKASLEASVRYLANDLGPEDIRVNAVSAGPIKTLAASGIAGFDAMRNYVNEKKPLKRLVEAEEVGDATLFLLCDWSRGITGETLYVDGGYNILGIL